MHACPPAHVPTSCVAQGLPEQAGADVRRGQRDKCCGHGPARRPRQGERDCAQAGAAKGEGQGIGGIGLQEHAAGWLVEGADDACALKRVNHLQVVD